MHSQRVGFCSLSVVMSDWPVAVVFTLYSR